MRATAAPEEGNKVRLSVEIDESEMDEALGRVMRRLATEVRVPGFRPGKVPRRVIEARMGGAAALRSEALREALPDFYARAVSDTAVDPIDRPDIDLISGEEAGVVSFEAVVEVRPTVSIAGYQGLSVTVPTLEVTDEEIDAQVDRLRATSGELKAVERPIASGDQVTLDIFGVRQGGSEPGEESESGAGDEDLSAEDFLYEVGTGRVTPELDDQLMGSSVGDTVEFESTPEGFDTSVSFTVHVKDVKELVLPDLTDEWAAESSEFETVQALVADIADRLRQVRLAQVRAAVQKNAIEALGELVTEDVPPVLVSEEVRQRLHDLGHRLEQQGISLSQFLSATGRSEEDFLATIRESALDDVRADLALRSLVEAESIEITEEELDEELASMGVRLEMSTEEVRRQLDLAGRLSAVRSDRQKAKALRWLTDNVELVDEQGNSVSRDDLAEAGHSEVGQAEEASQ